MTPRSMPCRLRCLRTTLARGHWRERLMSSVRMLPGSSLLAAPMPETTRMSPRTQAARRASLAGVSSMASSTQSGAGSRKLPTFSGVRRATTGRTSQAGEMSRTRAAMASALGPPQSGVGGLHLAVDVAEGHLVEVHQRELPHPPRGPAPRPHGSRRRRRRRPSPGPGGGPPSPGRPPAGAGAGIRRSC